MRNIRIRVVTLFVVLLAFLSAQGLFAQTNLTQPRVSPHATVSQTLAFTQIDIDYHRPAVKGREVWGKLVPYGMAPGRAFNFGNPTPWRAGANENTTITFSDAVTLEGTKVPAGTYGLHLLPVENDDWTLILSKDNAAWGSFFYDIKNDQARIMVTPVAVDQHQEWLMYAFEDITPTSAVAYLHWEKMKVPFTIEIDREASIMNNFRNQLTNLAGFNGQAWAQAAQFCLQNDMNLSEAITWIDKALAVNNTMQNIAVKALLLEKTGNMADAKKMREESMSMAKASEVEADINALGYVYFFNNQTDIALELFKLNVKKHPDAWNVYDSLAEAHQKKGNTAESVKNYKIALAKAPDGQKPRIQTILDGMSNM